jgi:hypothetical protein
MFAAALAVIWILYRQRGKIELSTRQRLLATLSLLIGIGTMFMACGLPERSIAYFGMWMFGAISVIAAIMLADSSDNYSADKTPMPMRLGPQC